jgi:hypothetical protein
MVGPRTKQITKKRAAEKQATKKPGAKKSAASVAKKNGAGSGVKSVGAGAAGLVKKSGLPAALAKRAATEVAAKRARLAKDGRADVALILRRRERIAEDFYDIGEALIRLKRPGIAEALGRASFRDVCTNDLQMSLTAAESLIAIVSGVARQDALRMGQERALALVTLARATPEADSARLLENTKRKLPSGKHLDVAKASVNELKAAAKELRAAASTGARSRGRTTTPEERTHAAALQAALHAAGLHGARVSAVATKPGQEADLRIERVPISAVATLRTAFGKVR